VTPLERLPGLAIARAMGLGFALSLLIFDGPKYFVSHGQQATQQVIATFKELRVDFNYYCFP
jgi:hypothetical protein